MNFIQRLMVGLGALCTSLILVSAQAQTQPIKVGGTLALTGPLSATAVMQKIAGEI
jgi:branched-chain amino acid transport system substrate-binding protein